MNKLKKTLVLVCCAALLVCISVGATLAYLTSQTEVVENTFTVGNVAIKLDEAQVELYGSPVDANGNKVAVGEAPRVLENQYKLLPGHTYTKDPTVHVWGGSEESYIRIFVTITDLKDVKAVLGKDATTGYFLPQYFVNGWDSDKWLTTYEVVESKELNSATYEFRYYQKVDDTLDLAKDKFRTVTPALFTEIKVPDEIVNTELAKLAEMEINVIAQAIQADGFVDTADGKSAMDNAWEGYGQTIQQFVTDMEDAANG